MITQEYLVGDLELRLSKSKPSQELEVTYEQMAYWIDQARDEVTREYLRTNRVADDTIVMELTDLTPYEVAGDIFVDLGVIPLDVKNGRSILYVRDSTGMYLSKQSQMMKGIISRMTFTRPSSCNIIYSLSGGSSLQIEGDEGMLSETYDVALIPSELSRIKDKDERYYLLPSTARQVVELAEDIGLRELTGRGIYDINNDGLGNDI